MYKKIILFIFSISISGTFLQAQENSISEWVNVLKVNKIELSELQAHAIGFPNLYSFTESKKLNVVLKKWLKKHPQEWKELDKKYSISNNHSVVYLGLYTSTEYENLRNNKIENSWIEWITGSKVSDRRLTEIAPHFPEYKNITDNDNFNQDIVWWQTVYPHEYERFVNAPELTVVNPYYKEHIDLNQVPYFIGVLFNYDKPKRIDSGDKFNDDLNYQLNLMNWYFVFENENFYKEFGFKPVFYESYDADAYRRMVVAKIENNKDLKEEEFNPNSK